MSRLDSFIAGLPKAELHVHHVGSASPRIVAQLAERHPGKVPSNPDDLARFFRFDDFAHFITIYLSVVELIRTAEDVRLLTYEVGADMATQNIRYAELTVTPYLSVSDRLPAEAFLEAIEDARVAAARDHGVELRWIFDIPADFGIPGAEFTTSIACDHDIPGLVGFGIGGAERGFPRPMFARYVDRARAAGLHSVPHAGETTGPQTVWDAIRDLGAERIEHGISAVYDQALLGRPRHHPGRLPDLQRGTQGCGRLGIPSDPRPGGRRCAGQCQYRRPADVRHQPQYGVRHRRAIARARSARDCRPRTHGRRVVLPR